MRTNHTKEIQAAQVGLLYEQAPSALTATSVNAVILTAVMWGQVPKPFLLVWLLLIFVVDLVRYGQCRTYLKDQHTIAESLRWGRRYIYGVAVNGLLWGIAGALFFVPDNYVYQVFLAFVLGGMVAGAISTLSPVRGAYLAFLIPALVPYAARLVIGGGELHLAMGGMVFFYVIMMWMISRRVFVTVAESLRLRFDNLSLLHDLTQARERQELANAELEQRVQERTEKLAHSEEALRDADRRKDEFLAMLGHELRNPLAPIRNAMYLMQMPGVSDSTLTRSREIVDRQIDHLTRLVDDLLDVSRIGQGKIRLKETSLDLTTVIDQAVEASRPLFETRQQELFVVVSEKPLWVRGDMVRLAQVISNLLNNAAKFTDTGGRIRLTVEGSEHWLTVRVVDNGIGIPANMLPHVFDLFTQADHSLARTQGGLGIGLTLVKRVIEMHGGRVEVHSAGPGRGSEFLLHLPRSAAPARVEARTLPSDAVGSQARRVLVVDDDQDSAESLAILLRLEGHTVAVAFDGATALAEAARFQPQAVLLDLGMPGMDGYDIVHELRAQEPTRSSVILALTGYGQPEDRDRSKAAGFSGHLTKPVDPNLLFKMLKASLT